VEIDPVEDRCAARVVEVDVLEPDVAEALDEVDRPGAVEDHGLLVEDLVDAQG
jgi:hypothetical protein